MSSVFFIIRRLNNNNKKIFKVSGGIRPLYSNAYYPIMLGRISVAQM